MAHTITDYPRYKSDGSGRDFYIHHNNGGFQGRHAVGDFQHSLRSSQQYHRYSQQGVLRLPRLDFKDREVAKRQRMLSKWLATPRTQRGLGIAVTDTASIERRLTESGSIVTAPQTARVSGAVRTVSDFGFTAADVALSPRSRRIVSGAATHRQATSADGGMHAHAVSSSGYQHSHSQSFSSSSSSGASDYAATVSALTPRAFAPRPPPRATATTANLPLPVAVA